MDIVCGDDLLHVTCKRPVEGQQAVILTSHLGREDFQLGYVMRTDDSWMAYGYTPNLAVLGRSEFWEWGWKHLTHRMESVRGFASRRYAIEHMLRRCGYWT